MQVKQARKYDVVSFRIRRGRLGEWLSALLVRGLRTADRRGFAHHFLFSRCGVCIRSVCVCVVNTRAATAVTADGGRRERRAGRTTNFSCVTSRFSKARRIEAKAVSERAAHPRTLSFDGRMVGSVSTPKTVSPTRHVNKHPGLSRGRVTGGRKRCFFGV